MSEVNGLSLAEEERLYILSEEGGEIIQAIGKILRHGYESYDPTGKIPGTNRDQLILEIGDMMVLFNMMVKAKDVDSQRINQRVIEKTEKIKRYLHHQ